MRICSSAILAALAVAVCGWSADRPALDVMIVVQDSGTARGYLRKADISGFRAGDTVAVMKFSKKSKVIVPFSGNFQKVNKSYGWMPVRVGMGEGPRKAPEVYLWDAIGEASRLFPGKAEGRRRVVIALFTDEDTGSKAGVDGALRALKAAGVSLSGSGIAREDALVGPARDAQTPPIGGPAGPPVTVRRGEIPETAYANLKKVAAETGGLALREEWDLPKLLEYARNR